MISQTYRLFAPRQIRMDLIDEDVSNDDVIIKPLYLSICKADMRYFSGQRKKSVLDKKLPMALIHEAVGEIIYDKSGSYEIGTKVVMVPNTPVENDDVIKENYLRTSHFKSSGYDGFMRNIVIMNKNRIIPYKNIEDRTAVLLELMSVSMNALEHFDKYSHLKKQTITVWGDGSVGFITSLILKYTFPNAKIVVIGHSYEKLNYFQFVDNIYISNNLPDNFYTDHAFECVGGSHSSDVINQIIDVINPEGSICLMGVSEENVSINTRLVLEKGLTLLGNSRSGYEDFTAAIEFLENYPQVKDYLNTIISDEIEVNNIKDMICAFEKDANNEFKTIMKWNI